MNTLLVVSPLRSREGGAIGPGITSHVRGVRVAHRARRGNVGGEDRRLGVQDAADAVRAVAARARGHLRVALGQTKTMHARGVFGGLIDPLPWRKAPHN